MEGARLETEAEGEKQKGEGEPSLLVGGVQWPHLGLVRVGYTPTCWAESPLEPYSLIHMCTLGVPVPALTSKDADILKSSWEQGSQTGSLLPGCPQVRGMPLAPSNTLPSPIHRSGGGKLRGVGGGWQTCVDTCCKQNLDRFTLVFPHTGFLIPPGIKCMQFNIMEKTFF